MYSPLLEARLTGRRVLLNALSQMHNPPYTRQPLHAGLVQVLPSLLAFDPLAYGLPPFSDVVSGVIPLDAPFRIRGTVVKGFGRGSKV